ncbi:MAG TPA: class 1 fructose-bisphosphatase [Methylocella sp.]|nr:class 1 fructose-bisphosphatase [Methylocella sp.]
MPQVTLSSYLGSVAAAGEGLTGIDLALRAVAAAANELSSLISLGRLYGQLGASRGSTNVGGDVQKELDVLANELLVNAFKGAPIAAIVSEELSEPLVLNPSAPFAVAMDPLDGSSNIDANVSIGTIFSILPTRQSADSPEAHFLQSGRHQIAAGFIVYGPQTSLVFALHNGSTQVFILNRHDGEFHRATVPAIPREYPEYAVNASYYRHWDAPVRAFIDDCVQGAEGPLKRDYNMRWTGSLVADAYRILLRGGVFLYPGDQRPGYHAGRLRLLYEANPVAFVVEHAGGKATDCIHPILDIAPSAIHARTPLIFGSTAAVELVARYHTDPQYTAEHAPLFGKRGLIRP